MLFVQTLFDSELPFPAAAIVAIWLMLYIANHLVASALRALNARQTYIAVENREALARSSRPLWILAQVLYAAVVFTVSFYIGGAMFVFFAGGLDICLICILGLNVQALLGSQAMVRAGACEGTLKLSTGYAYRQLGSRLFGAALVCALLAALLAHLALFGGAMLCAAASAGYYRRAGD
jgi:hypothetical protein